MDEFINKSNIFSKNILKIFLYIKDNRDIFTKKVYSELISASRLLEDFLDYHGAKNNKEWYFYRELIATVEHISLGAYSQKHIKNRLPFYNIEDITGFKLDIDTSSAFFNNTLYKLAPIIINEAKRLNIEIPRNTYKKKNYPLIITKEILEYNIEDINRTEQNRNIVKIASDFINMVNKFKNFIIYEQYDIEKIKKLIPDKINVVEIRRFEMMLHNLQSYFDSYVIYNAKCLRTSTKKKLLKMRGYFSITFHLFQVVGRLLHYYERHLYDKGYKSTYKECVTKLKNIVDVEELLDSTVNYGLYYASSFLILGKKISEELLEQNVERSTVTLPVPTARGFHFRPSTMVSSVVEHYGSKVILKVKDKEFDAGSMLEITWAGGLIKKENIKNITFKGDKRVLKDLKLLASLNYGEDMMGNKISFPQQLNYLWDNLNGSHKEKS